MQRVSLMRCILPQDGDVVFKASTNTDSTLRLVSQVARQVWRA